MSHSTGYGVQVSAAELARRRAVAEGQARCAELRRRALEASRAAAQSGAASIAIPAEPRIRVDASAADAKAAADKYEARVGRVLASISEARAEAFATAFAAQAPPSISGSLSIAWKSRATLVTPAADAAEPVAIEEPLPAATETDADAAKARAARIVTVLAGLDDDGLRDQLAARTSATIDAPDAKRQLDGIWRDVDAALRDQANLTAIHQEAGELVATLRSYATPAADRARTALIAATRRDQLVAAATLARDARVEAEAHEEQDFVLEQTAEVLRELGYQVGDSFVETAESGEFALATNDGLGDYALQVRAIDGGKRILTNTVALDADTTHQQDVAAQEHVCSDLAIVAERLGRRGVRLDQYFESKPGEMPIERRLDARPAETKRTQRSRRVTPRGAEAQR